jgi:putative FmdB family regulatory protein
MPTYEYACSQCGHKFEEFQSIQAEPIRECPQCAGRVERLINGGVGLIFKGSGFYLTDYRKSNTSGASADNGDAAKPEKAGAKKETAATEKSANKTSSASVPASRD